MLTKEGTIKYPWYKTGDMKIAHYAITYSAHTITKPTDDPNWMLLNGAVLSQTTYPALYALYGTSYNTGGEGAGNFRIPDLTEGKIPMTRGLTNFTTLGVSGGEINHTTTSAEMPGHVHSVGLVWAANSHAHGSSGSLSSNDSHSHTMSSTLPSGTTRNYGGTGTRNAYSSNTGVGTDQGSANHFHSGSFSVVANTSPVSWASSGVNAAGSGGGHNNMQPYIVVGGWLVLFG